MQDAVFKTGISGDFVLCWTLYARYKKEGGGGMEHFERKGIGEALFGLPYPGRGILLGMGENGRDLFLSYFIMGRSENSRNRVFREEGEELRIDPACPERLSDPSLVLYSPLRSVSGRLIVANGDQSDTIHDFLEAGKRRRFLRGASSRTGQMIRRGSPALWTFSGEITRSPS